MSRMQNFHVGAKPFTNRFPWKLVLTLSLIFCLNVFGEDELLQGGLSPDKRYEVRIFQTDSRDPSDYYYVVVDAKSKQVIQKLDEGGGVCVYEGAKEMAQVLWHSSGNFFALTDHGSRHSMEMYVYEVTPPKVTLLTTQDYAQNALGRVGATSVYATTVVKPLRWDKDDLICSYTFDTQTGQGRGPTYTTEFTLHLEYAPNMASSLAFEGMKTPTDQN